MTVPPATTVEVELVIVRCEACGAAVPIADQDTVGCPYCQARVAMPEAHRQAVRLVRAQDAELLHAQTEWARYARKTLPRWLVIPLSIPPSLILNGGLVLAVLAKRGLFVSSLAPRVLFGVSGLLPLAPAAALFVLAYWSADEARQVGVTRLLLAARPGKVPSCRNCGAPLSALTGAMFVRCAYCGTDSLVTLDVEQAGAVEENTARAEASANVAIESAHARRKQARWASKWMVVIWGGMSGVVLVWALLPALDSVLGLFAFVMFALSLYTDLLTIGTAIEVLSLRRAQGVLVLVSVILACAATAAMWYIAS